MVVDESLEIFNSFFTRFRDLYSELLDNSLFTGLEDCKDKTLKRESSLEIFRSRVLLQILRKFFKDSDYDYGFNLRSIEQMLFRGLKTIGNNENISRITIKEEGIKKIEKFVNSYKFHLPATPLISSQKTNKSNQCYSMVSMDILGKLFESSLTLTKTRGKKGTFYTPKSIGEYMARNVLDLYFCSHLKNEFTWVSSLFPENFSILTIFPNIHQVRDPESPNVNYIYSNILVPRKKEHNNSFSENKKGIKAERFSLANFYFRLYQILSDLKICDNAVGSSSLLLMMCEYLYFLYAQIWQFFQQFKGRKPPFSLSNAHEIVLLKKRIIEENIFGFDIDHQAIVVSKLRLWLWIHDYNFTFDPHFDHSILKNTEITPIKNIQFNLFNKNPLLLFGKAQVQNRSKKVLDSFFDDLTSSKGKDLRERVSSSSSNSSHSFNDCSSNKFDIIFGNPPYGQNKLPKPVRKKIKDIWPKVHSIGSKKNGKSYNPSAAFIEHSHRMLKQDGILAYIVNNSIGRVDEFSQLRKFMLKNFQFLKIVDEGNPFEEMKVTLEMITLFLQKMPSDQIDPNQSFHVISKRKAESKNKKKNTNQISYIPQNVWLDFNRFILYYNSLFPKLYNPKYRQINILHGKRGRDVKKKKKITGVFSLPYLFSGRSVKKYKIVPKYVEYAPRSLLQKQSWKEELNAEMLVTTKIGDYFRVMYKPPGMLVGNNVIKLRIDDDFSPLVSFTPYSLMAILNSRLMDYIVQEYIINRSELTMAFYDSITMFAPIPTNLNKKEIFLLDYLGKMRMIWTNFLENREEIDSLIKMSGNKSPKNSKNSDISSVIELAQKNTIKKHISHIDSLLDALVCVFYLIKNKDNKKYEKIEEEILFKLHTQLSKKNIPKLKPFYLLIGNNFALQTFQSLSEEQKHLFYNLWEFIHSKFSIENQIISTMDEMISGLSPKFI